jgi:hypothetical protein
VLPFLALPPPLFESGTVVDAFEATTGRTVAMKVMLSSLSEEEILSFIGEAQITSTRAPLPSLPTQSGVFIEVDISADSQANPSWAHPVRSFFRRTNTGWKLVGLERMPDQPQVSAPGAGKR